MKIRTFRASSMHEALARVREELGPDAAVLHTREVAAKGFWPLLLGKREIEVTASRDVPVPARRPAAGSSVSDRSPQNRSGGAAQPPRRPPSFVSDPQRGEKTAAVLDSTAKSELQQQIDHLQRMMDELSQRRRTGPGHDPPPRLFSLFTELIDVDFPEQLARELVQRVQADVPEAELDDAREIKSRIHRMIEERITIAGPIQVAAGSRRIVALVGPTGVGKTTTIAKLAANFRLREKRRVGLITVDTYRIAAIEQLRIYAEIIDLPMEVVGTPREMRQAIDKLKDQDVVFIDTAGRSLADDVPIQELRALLQEAHPEEVHLVLSCVCGAKNLIRAAQLFAPVKPTALVLTKLDEATTVGNILPLLDESKLAISYLTDGQNVPDDIEPADQKKLAARILGATTE